MLLVEKALYVCDFTFYVLGFHFFCVKKKHEILGFNEKKK